MIYTSTDLDMNTAQPDGLAVGPWYHAVATMVYDNNVCFRALSKLDGGLKPIKPHRVLHLLLQSSAYWQW